MPQSETPGLVCMPARTDVYMYRSIYICSEPHHSRTDAYVNYICYLLLKERARGFIPAYGWVCAAARDNVTQRKSIRQGKFANIDRAGMGLKT